MEPRQLGVPPDQRARPPVSGSNRRGCPGVGSGLGDQPISPAMAGLDDLGSPGIVVQPLPYLSDAHRQRRVAHGDARPDGLPQLVFRHQSAGVG